MTNNSNTSPPEHALAAYVVNLSFDQIGPEEREQTAKLIFDTVAISIGAHNQNHKSGLIAEDHCLDVYARNGKSRLWSGRGVFPADIAALCNGTWAELLDFQDVVVDPRNNGHLGVTIVPAAFAVAEREHSSGSDLITAIAAGIEVSLSILRAVGRRHRSEGRGFRTTSLAAPLGAAIACGKLIGLNEAEMLNAMGIAGACSPNGLMPSLSPSNGSFGMDKDWVNGLAAQLAVNAADLAKRGMTGSDRVVTGEFGILASHAHGDEAALVIPKFGAPGMGSIALKKFAACYGVHSAMEATIELMSENNINADDIVDIIVGVKADSAVTLSGRNIQNHMAARFSLAYAVASSVIRGEQSSARDFEEPAIFDKNVIAMMDKVKVVANDELTQFHRKTGGFPAHVEIRAKDTTVEHTIYYPSGSLQRPMSWDDIGAKFFALTKGHLQDDQLRHIFGQAQDFEKLEDINKFSDLLQS